MRDEMYSPSMIENVKMTRKRQFENMEAFEHMICALNLKPV